MVSLCDLATVTETCAGRLRIERLLFVREHCPLLSNECQSLALKWIQTDTLDARLYASSGGCDQQWVESTTKVAKERQEKLEEELKNYKSNHIKESIRVRLLYLECRWHMWI